MATNKYLTNNAGAITEVLAPTTSQGSGDSGKIPALNSDGVLAASIVNSKSTSAGAGDVGKLPSLDATGRLDSSFMPVGLGADTQVITASEALAAGDYVNVWNSTGAKVRKADATNAGKEAHGFVLASVLSSGAATVYFEGTNTSITGATPGVVYLSTTAGLGAATAPTGSTNVVQRLGFAASSSAVNFHAHDPIILA